MLKSALLAGLLLFGAVPAMSVSGDVVQQHEEQPVIQNRAQLEAHLESTETSPLFHLSEPGLRVFLDGLFFGEDHVFPVDRTALVLELNASQTRDVLALFGIDSPGDANGPEKRVPVAESDLIDDYYGHEHERRRLIRAAPTRRDPDARHAVLALFDRTFGAEIRPAALEAQTPADLRVLHAAIAKVFFDTHEPALLPHSVNVVSEFDEKIRGTAFASSRLAEETYRQLVVAREFDKADTFARRYDIAPFEWNVVTPGASLSESGPMMLVPVEDGDNLSLRVAPVSLDGDLRVIASVGSGCSFSKAAVEYIEADDELRQLLAGRTTWLTHQGATSQLEPVVEWNRKARETRMNIVYRDKEWPSAFDFALTPVFHILRDGEVQEEIVGWPDDSQGEKLKKVLREFAREEPAERQ